MPENFERPKAANENIPYARQGFGDYIEDLKDLMDYAHMCIGERNSLNRNIDRMVSNPNEKQSLLGGIDYILNDLSVLSGEIEVARLSAEADRLDGRKREHLTELGDRLRTLIEAFDTRYLRYFPVGR